jgi:hypothetical protein
MVAQSLRACTVILLVSLWWVPLAHAEESIAPSNNAAAADSKGGGRCSATCDRGFFGYSWSVAGGAPDCCSYYNNGDLDKCAHKGDSCSRVATAWFTGETCDCASSR